MSRVARLVRNACLSSLLCTAPRAAAGAGAPWPEVWRRAAPGVVLVVATDARGAPVGQAGFVVSPEGKILTLARGLAGHAIGVTRQDIFVYIKPAKLVAQASRNLVDRFRAQIVAAAPREPELALLQLENAPEHLTALVFGEAGGVNLGTELLAVGHPEAAGLWSGQLLSRTPPGEGGQPPDALGERWFSQTQLPAGTWGGPVLDAVGRVVGVVVPPLRRLSPVRRSDAEGEGDRGIGLDAQIIVGANSVLGWLAQSNMALASQYSPPADDPASASDNPTPQPSTVTVDGPAPDADAMRRRSAREQATASAWAPKARPSTPRGAAPVVAAAPCPCYITPLCPFSMEALLAQRRLGQSFP